MNFRSFPLYKNESEKRNVKLTYLPAQKRTEDYCIILLAGGAYGAVCTMVESLPVAAKFNELGIDCFCLNYETATPDSFEKGLLPAPLDDLAKSCKLIFETDKFDYKTYCVCGFFRQAVILLHFGVRILSVQRSIIFRCRKHYCLYIRL